MLSEDDIARCDEPKPQDEQTRAYIMRGKTILIESSDKLCCICCEFVCVGCEYVATTCCDKPCHCVCIDKLVRRLNKCPICSWQAL